MYCRKLAIVTKPVTKSNIHHVIIQELAYQSRAVALLALIIGHGFVCNIIVSSTIPTFAFDRQRANGDSLDGSPGVVMTEFSWRSGDALSFATERFAEDTCFNSCCIRQSVYMALLVTHYWIEFCLPPCVCIAMSVRAEQCNTDLQYKHQVIRFRLCCCMGNIKSVNLVFSLDTSALCYSVSGKYIAKCTHEDKKTLCGAIWRGESVLTPG